MANTSDDILFFVPTYPEVDTDPNYTYSITKKKEFYDHKLERSEEVPKTPGVLLQSQKLMQRLFSPDTPYRIALIGHGIGTGKSCTAAGIVERFKSLTVNGRARKPALVFVVSEEIGRNISNEIAFICTKDTYLARLTEAEIRRGIPMTEETRIARLNRAIARTYEIVPMEATLKNLPSDDIIRSQYSDRDIIVDEAHKFRLQPRRGKKKSGLPSSAPVSAIGVVVEEQIEEEYAAEFKGGYDEGIMMYNQMHHFLHTVQRCRKFLLTGTPIWDRSAEIASLLNLILDEDNQLPTGSEFDDKFFDHEGNLNEETVEELKDKMRGIVSFLRPMVTTARRLEEGTKQPWLNYVTVFPDAMSETQSVYAKKAREEVETKTIRIKGKPVEREVKGGTVLKIARDAMNMVLPVFDIKGAVTDVEYGPAAFKKHIVKQKPKRTPKGKIITVQVYSIDDRFLKAVILNNLREYSAKFSSIIEDIKAHPKEITFIYNEEVTGLGGAIMLGLCMQIHGFKWIHNSSDIAQPSTVRRIAVITSDPQTTNQPKQIQDLLLSSNRPDNKYADRLQVIIGSEKIALGLSIKNVRRIHVVMPHWNLAAGDQGEGRGLRVGGHDALPPAERVVHIFRHVAVDESTATTVDESLAYGKGYPVNVGFTDTQTTDIYIYRIAESKEHKNAQIYRLLKELDPLCALFYNRNVLPEDVDGMRVCVYKECNYQCDSFPETEVGKPAAPAHGTAVWDYSIEDENIDYSTYNLLYGGERIKEIIDRIVELFSINFSIYIDVAQKTLGILDVEKSLMLQAVDTIINSRIAIRNAYGFISYLKEKNNMLFLDNNISDVHEYSQSIYLENPLVVEITSLDALVEIIELENDREQVQNFCTSPTTEIWDSVAYKTKIILLEAAYIKSMANEHSDATNLIVDDMGDRIFIMNDGVPVHILYSDEFKGLAYDVAAKDIRATGVMRMFDSEYGMWRYVDSAETENAYVTEIKAYLSERVGGGFEDNPYGSFGWISKKDKSFRIHLKPDEKKGQKFRGRKCVNYTVPELVDIFMERLDHLPTPKPTYLSYTKLDLIKAIKGVTGFSKYKVNLEARDLKYLRGLLTLLTTKTEELCIELQKFYTNKELMYEM